MYTPFLFASLVVNFYSKASYRHSYIRLAKSIAGFEQVITHT